MSVSINVASPPAAHRSPQVAPVVVALAIAPPSRLRVCVCILFALAYAIGAVAMAVQFKNPVGASGFAVTALMVLFFIVLLKHAPERIQHCTFLSVTRQGMFLFVALTAVFLGLSFFWLSRALNAHEEWTGDSQFSGFIAFLMAAKWSVCCALRIRFFRSVAQRYLARGVVVQGVAISSTGTVVETADAHVTGVPVASQCPYQQAVFQQQQAEEKRKLLP